MTERERERDVPGMAITVNLTPDDRKTDSCSWNVANS
jgi:hypothetical protein